MKMNSVRKSFANNIDLVISELNKTATEATLVSPNNFTEVYEWEQKFKRKCKVAATILTKMRSELRQYYILSPKEIEERCIQNADIIEEELQKCQQVLYRLVEKLEKYKATRNENRY